MSNLTFEEGEIIIKNHQEAIPVDVVSIANEMGIKVYSAKDWSENLSGMIKQVNGAYSIYVNDSHNDVRKRFTIAHELAHFLLHRPQIGDGIIDDTLYRSGLSNFVESEANAFAADILMPRNKIDLMWKDPNSTLASMAKGFNVSQQAMAIRLGVPN